MVLIHKKKLLHLAWQWFNFDNEIITPRMSSIIEGYNYDIFISYRQKDNKGDRWVSEFVGALKTELESTFKEEISVYFDINPHDGLLETHDVNASLKEKLKCLVFIPIISRTYCDPKSFAWEHEFKAFVEQASKDQFGLKAILPNGNVASRVLPVRIYFLNAVDIKLCESVMGGILRGVEFIYAEPGVNRPLKPDDDEKLNLNKTKYRNQINKVANAINDIILGLKNEPEQYENLLNEGSSTNYKPIRKEKSIIVLPFENISSDPGQEYFSDGLTEEIITDLSHIHELLVISRSSAMTFKGAKYTVKEIAEKVNVKYVLEGSVRKAGNNLRITAQLIDANNDFHVWAGKYDKSVENIFEIQENVSRSITDALKIELYPEERKQTANLRAYDMYLLGRYYWNKRTKEGLRFSMDYFRQAIESDHNYALAYSGLADAYCISADWNYLSPIIAFEKAREYTKIALSLDNNLAEAYATLALISEEFDHNSEKAETFYQTALSLNSNYASVYQWYALFLTVFGRFDKAVYYMNQALKLDPLSAIKNAACGLMYYYAESYDDAILQCKKATEFDPQFPVSLNSFIMFLCYFHKGFMTKAINEYQKALADSLSFEEYKNNVDKIYSESGVNGFLDFIIDLELKNPETKIPVPSLRKLAFFYAMRGNKQKALDYIEINVNEFITDYLYMNVEPTFKELRSEPRFLALLKKLGLDR